jgi:2-polyprenyl-6-methoxyphenol hydroxylase-like FAD-dependent oxidoreductase
MTSNRAAARGTGTRLVDRRAARLYLLSPFHSTALTRKRRRHRRSVSGHCAESVPGREGHRKECLAASSSRPAMTPQRRSGDPKETMGRFDIGRIFIMINRGEYWQCGFVIPKGSMKQVQERGLQAFRESVAQVAQFAADRVGELREWEAVKLLTVRVDRLPQWYRTGLLCIGDAAHAMSPIGGVGINLAIQDAIAAANVLAVPLRAGQVTERHLHRVQRRREWPTHMTQWGQVFIQNRVITRVLSSVDKLTLPFPLRMLARFPFLRRIPARLIGIGFRPEHVKSPAV